MIIMKFGGTSVGSAERIINLTKIVRSRLAKKPIVVVSALSGVTDSLIDLAKVALNGGVTRAKLDAIKERHYKVLHDLGLNTNIIAEDLDDLKRLSESIALLEELTPKTLDSVMSFGERMSSKIIAAYLSKTGIPSQAYAAYDIGMVTNSNFGSADVLDSSYKKMHGSISRIKAVIPVVTGFIGEDKNGEITTLGRGGSDYTASIIGYAVDAKAIEIWTDVNGIMTADPKIVKGAKTISTVSYDEASELAYLGAKVLHPNTILPAVKKNIPVIVLNTFNPKHNGTTVLRISRRKGVASIACKKKIDLINISQPKMFMAHGFLKKTFEVFDHLGLSVDLVSTSEASLSVTLDKNCDLDALVNELGKFAVVDLKSNMAKISIVGSGLAHKRGLLAQIFSALGGISTEMISSSTSDINQSIVVSGVDADTAVRKLHKEFFGV